MSDAKLNPGQRSSTYPKRTEIKSKKTGLVQSTPSTFTLRERTSKAPYGTIISSYVVSGPIPCLLHPVPSHKRGSVELDSRDTIKSNGADIHAIFMHYETEECVRQLYSVRITTNNLSCTRQLLSCTNQQYQRLNMLPKPCYQSNRTMSAPRFFGSSECFSPRLWNWPRSVDRIRDDASHVLGKVPFQSWSNLSQTIVRVESLTCDRSI